MHRSLTTSGRPPVPLRAALDIGELCRADPCEATSALGSFWLGSRTSFESRLVKAFKACCPAKDFEPHISALCRFYGGLVIESVAGIRFDWVVRVLGSAETEPERGRPLSLLADIICAMTDARSATDVFFKSQARPPMRVVDRLAGPAAMKARLQYLAQDLFVRPYELSGNVLLLDDICNTGASTRVYAQALKQHAGADRVCAVNLAATRFAGGKDGRGMLQLDISGLGDPAFSEVWIDRAGTFHIRQDCPRIDGKTSDEVRFVAERSSAPCPFCIQTPQPRKWWRIWQRGGHIA